MYAFPTAYPAIYEKWLEVCLIDEAFEKQHKPKICHHCFVESDFEELEFGKKKRKLKKDSVPRVTRKRLNEVREKHIFKTMILLHLV